MPNPLISGLGAFASAFLDEDAEALSEEATPDDNIDDDDLSATPNLEPIEAIPQIVPNISNPSTQHAANTPTQQPAFAPVQNLQNTNMPKPAFSPSQSPASSPADVDSTPAPKAKMLNFGDALAQGLPQSWSIVPPTANIVQKPTMPKPAMPTQMPKRNF